MASNRVGGPTPSEPGKSAQEKLQSQQQKRVEKVEKIKEVDEVEQDQTRKKFQQYMGEEEEPATHVPSPFETDFYFGSSSGSTSATGQAPPTSSSSLGEMGQTAVPSPGYSAPPDVSTSPSPSQQGNTALPRSNMFWKGVNEPPDLPPTTLKFQEISQSTQGAKTGKEGSSTGTDQGRKGTARPQIPVPPLPKDSFFGPPGKPTMKPASSKESTQQQTYSSTPPSIKKPIEAKALTPFSSSPEQEAKLLVPKEEPFSIEKRSTKAEPAKNKEKAPTPIAKDEDESAPTVRYLRPEEEKQGTSPFAVPGKEGGKSAPAVKKGEPFAPPPPHMGKEAKIARMPADEKEEGSSQKQQVTETLHPALPDLPPNIMPLAEAAATQATPYLNPELLPLFYQMTGMIYVMVSEDVSRTDIILNAPSFANSKFYGSTITIEKYATAPDSLNIRLTGSTEAVTTFNQNIANLYAAFQNGNFNFRIGRIEAVYSLDRPVFRRKDPKERKDGYTGEFGDQRNK